MDGGVTEKENESTNAEESLNTNPMLIEVILKQIIENLPFQNLKTCRLINTLWNEKVTRSKRFKSKSRNFVVFGYYTKYEMGNPLGDMIRLADCLRSPLFTMVDNFPLHTFIVVTSGIDLKDSLKESILTDFLNAVSPITEKILIQHERKFFHNDPLNKIGAAEIQESFPRLKYLKLDLSEPELGIISTILEHLMRPGNSPELEKLYIRWRSWRTPVSTSSKLLSQLNVPTTTSKLTSLKIKSRLKPQHLRELNNLELNLREFHIEVENSSDLETASTLSSILEKQSKTLATLKIKDWREDFEPNIRVRQVQIFPETMINLESLIIHTEKIIFDDILLKERFPGLKSVAFTGPRSPWNEFFGSQIEPTLSINELKVTTRLRDEAILLKAVEYFPNIKKLQIPAESNMTNVVFDKMPQLEELTLDTTDFRCIDHIITGMTLEECEDVLARMTPMTDWKKNIEVLESIRDVRLTTKPISCLTKLKTLRLISMDYSNAFLSPEYRKVGITKLSYLMVLLNMDSLRCIDFGERRCSPNYQLEPSMWKRVNEKFQILCTNRLPGGFFGQRVGSYIIQLPIMNYKLQ